MWRKALPPNDPVLRRFSDGCGFAQLSKRATITLSLAGSALISPLEPVDFDTLRAKADAVAAALKLNFKTYEIGGVLEFPAGGIRIAEMAFLYFFPFAPP
jgi:hypothetical protein